MKAMVFIRLSPTDEKWVKGIEAQSLDHPHFYEHGVRQEGEREDGKPLSLHYAPREEKPRVSLMQRQHEQDRNQRSRNPLRRPPGMVPDRCRGGVWYLYPLLTQLSPQGTLSPDTPVPFFLSRFYRFAFLEIFWLKNIHSCRR